MHSKDTACFLPSDLLPVVTLTSRPRISQRYPLVVRQAKSATRIGAFCKALPAWEFWVCRLLKPLAERLGDSLRRSSFAPRNAKFLLNRKKGRATGWGSPN